MDWISLVTDCVCLALRSLVGRMGYRRDYDEETKTVWLCMLELYGQFFLRRFRGRRCNRFTDLSYDIDLGCNPSRWRAKTFGSTIS